MDSDFFISASEALILTNDKFNFFVNHLAPDNLTPGPGLDTFKKAVITYLVAHGLVFPINANNITPTSAAKFAANYTVSVKMMKGIQGQLSNACITSMETMIFMAKAVENHLLELMLIWKCVVDSVHKISKDLCLYMTALQHHTGHFNCWELEGIDTWMKRLEMLLQDLLLSGHTKAIADDCIVNNLLNALKNIPVDAPYGEDWKFTALSWKTEHAKNQSMTWLGIKSLMVDEIMARRDEVSTNTAASGRPSKKPKVAGPIGMALIATELSAAVTCITALSEQFQDHDKQQVRTRAGKECEDCTAEACKNAKSNLVPGTPSKSSLKTNSNSRPTTPNSDN
eukprot:3941297-Rhodomonas_salina.1